MRKTIYIQPRRTGKTANAVAKFLENPTKTLMFVLNNSEKRQIIDEYHLLKYADNIVTQYSDIDSIFTKLIFRNIHNINSVVIDEYFKFDYTYIHTIRTLILNLSNLSELNIYSTPIEQYDKDIFDSIKRVKNYGDVPFKYNTELSEIYTEEPIAEYEMLLDNYLTDSDVNIIVTDYRDYSPDYMQDCQQYHQILGTKKFETQFECKYLKKFKWITQKIEDSFKPKFVKHTFNPFK